MGGEVWELMRERAERLEREAREEGREKGREETVDIMVEQLRDQGVSDDVITKAVEAVASFTSSPLSE